MTLPPRYIYIQKIDLTPRYFYTQKIDLTSSLFEPNLLFSCLGWKLAALGIYMKPFTRRNRQQMNTSYIH